VTDEYDAQFSPQRLLRHIEGRRDDAARKAVLEARTIEPRITAHLDGAEQALEVVAAAERHIAEETDLDLSSDTRQVAVWLLVGRLVGLARAAIVLLRLGFCAEVVPTLRVMHETTRILHAVSDRDEAGLLRRWLEDEKYIRPYEARKVDDRVRLRQAPNLEALIQQSRDAGQDELAAHVEAALEALHLDADDDFLEGLSVPIYDRLSHVSHSRRSGMNDSVSVKLREIVMEPHPSWEIRATYVAFAGEVIEEVLIACGGGLSSAFWPNYFTQHLQPLINALCELRDKHPLE
jgi:superfamily I DNA/RNA helicase